MNLEQTVLTMRKHKVIFMWPFLFIGVGYILHQLLPQDYLHLSAAFFLLGGLLALATLLLYHKSGVLITNQRIFLTRGFIRLKGRSIRLEEIDNVRVSQNLTGFLCRYGDLILTGHDGKKAEFIGVAKPRALKLEIERLMAEVRA